jgi:leucyl aminopeptidase
MIRLSTEQNNVRSIQADVVAYFVFEDKDLLRNQVTMLEQLLGGASTPLRSPGFEGKEKQTLLLYPQTFRTDRLLLVGLGKRDDLTLERLRRASAFAAKAAREIKSRTLALFEPDPSVVAKSIPKDREPLWQTVGSAMAEGAVLGLYRYDKYLTDEKEKLSSLQAVRLVSEEAGRARSIDQGVKIAHIVCEATHFARDLANAPGNEIFPDSLARRAQAAGRTNGFSVSVFKEKKIAQLRMGGLLGVSRGSARPPRFIIMEYNRRQASRGTVVLVGKGVTFDSGGISIKPSANMAEMKMDMSGAAAVMGTMQAAARLKIPLHVVGLVPATENLPSGTALKPGDILVHYNGKTSEIDNTDAEGRLILADALSYAERFSPDLVIDLATLTGAVVVALGHHATGMLGNDSTSMERLKEAGDRTYERVWQLPMFDEYEKLIKSDIADVKNTGGRWGGAITAALFLKRFIGKYKWVHLDIAGTAIMEEPFEYIPKGGSGVGVRLLTDFLRHWRK